MIDTYTQGKEILFSFKTVIVGPPSAGKTCLFNRFCFNSFNFDTSLTIGVNFHSMDLKIRSKDENKNDKETYNVQSIFDFGGQERFKALIPKFLGGANGVLLVFDLTRPKTLDSIPDWYEDVKSYLKKGVKGYVVGNKNDLVDYRKINKDEALKTAEKLKLGYVETSALTGENVDDAFSKLGELLKQI